MFSKDKINEGPNLLGISKSTLHFTPDFLHEQSDATSGCECTSIRHGFYSYFATVPNSERVTHL